MEINNFLDYFFLSFYNFINLIIFFVVNVIKNVVSSAQDIMFGPIIKPMEYLEILEFRYSKNALKNMKFTLNKNGKVVNKGITNLEDFKYAKEKRILPAPKEVRPKYALIPQMTNQKATSKDGEEGLWEKTKNVTTNILPNMALKSWGAVSVFAQSSVFDWKSEKLKMQYYVLEDIINFGLYNVGTQFVDNFVSNLIMSLKSNLDIVKNLYSTSPYQIKPIVLRNEKFSCSSNIVNRTFDDGNEKLATQHSLPSQTTRSTSINNTDNSSSTTTHITKINADVYARRRSISEISNRNSSLIVTFETVRNNLILDWFQEKFKKWFYSQKTSEGMYDDLVFKEDILHTFKYDPVILNYNVLKELGMSYNSSLGSNSYKNENSRMGFYEDKENGEYYYQVVLRNSTTSPTEYKKRYFLTYDSNQFHIEKAKLASFEVDSDGKGDLIRFQLVFENVYSSLSQYETTEFITTDMRNNSTSISGDKTNKENKGIASAYSDKNKKNLVYTKADGTVSMLTETPI